MARVLKRVVDAERKLEIVTLIDDYGARHVIQHPVCKEGYDAEAAELAELEAMRGREQRFAEWAKSKGHDPEALKKGK